MIQIGAVEQGKYIGIGHIPQLVADGRTEILHPKGIAHLAVVAAAAAFGNGELNFRHGRCPL
jgi:hypothetical protein